MMREGIAHRLFFIAGIIFLIGGFLGFYAAVWPDHALACTGIFLFTGGFIFILIGFYYYTKKTKETQEKGDAGRN